MCSTKKFVAFPSRLSSGDVPETSFEPFTPLGRSVAFTNNLEQFVISPSGRPFSKKQKVRVKLTGEVENGRWASTDLKC